MCHKSLGSQKLAKGRVVAHAMSCAATVFFPARTAFMVLHSGRGMLAAALLLGLCATASADDMLFENVRIFDGKGAALSAPSNVLVEGNVIAEISTSPIE